jgi:hypothetical protein
VFGALLGADEPHDDGLAHRKCGLKASRGGILHPNQF